MITQTGKLVYGIEHGGKVHVDFELRLPTIGDNITALEEVGTESNLRLGVAMMAASIVSLGDIPPEEITYELLAKELVDDDYDVLKIAQSQLKKSRTTSSNVAETTA